MSKKIACRVIKTSQFIERRDYSTQPANQNYRRHEDASDLKLWHGQTANCSGYEFALMTASLSSADSPSGMVVDCMA